MGPTLSLLTLHRGKVSSRAISFHCSMLKKEEKRPLDCFIVRPMSSQVGNERAATTSAALGTSGSTSATLGWVNPPPGLQLTQVHYLIRHGERTPVRERLQKASPAIPVRWNMCHASKDFRVQVLDVGKGDQVQTKNWKGETLQGVPSEMHVHRRVETTDDKDNALNVRPGDW